jgi:replication factor A1
VTKRGPKKEWKNDRSTGTLFSVDLLDESGEIRATGFNETCVKYYDILTEGQTFYFKGGKLKPANRKWTTVNHDYEISFDNTTEIWAAPGDDLPQIRYAFLPIKQLPEIAVSAETNSTVDILAVVLTISEPTTIITKANRTELTKREIQLQDGSGCAIQCTLWGEDANKFEERGGAVESIVAIKVLVELCFVLFWKKK